MSAPRGLSDEESAAWERLAATVTPLAGRKPAGKPAPGAAPQRNSTIGPARAPVVPKVLKPVTSAPAVQSPKRPDAGLDSHWDRKLKAGALQPDYTLDLHGHSLDSAYDRLMSGLDQAVSMEARVVLLIAGRSRPVDPADRGTRRGAIRAKILDWLAASRHSQAIAAVRRAHIRHGGEGALYLVLKRRH